MREAEFSELKGQTLCDIRVSDNQEEMYFDTTSMREYILHHNQDCCETVYLAEVIGDLEDLLGNPILDARVESYEERPEEWEVTTWTFYILSTIKGSVTLRWCGTSNGYYSTAVDFDELTSRKGGVT